MTKMSTRKQKHALLVKAKTLLARDTSETGPFRLARFLCTAIRDANDCIDTDAARQDVIDLIRQRLSYISTLDGWLEYHHGIFGYQFKDYVAYLDRMQVTRHAWIDSLIREFE